VKMTTSPIEEEEFNAQTLRLRAALTRGEELSTRRSAVLAQIFFCDGCCCGRSDKGFPSLPKEMIKERWKALKLNGTIQLTLSGCLGPCDLANVFYLLDSNGVGQWFGGLSEEWQYDTLIQWATECHQAGSMIPIPPTLECHRFTRFEPVSVVPQACSLSGQTLNKTS